MSEYRLPCCGQLASEGHRQGCVLDRFGGAASRSERGEDSGNGPKAQVAACAATPPNGYVCTYRGPHEEHNWKWIAGPAAQSPQVGAAWRDELWETHLRVGFPGSEEDARFLMLGLCGEVGELANLIKKQWRRDDYPAEKRRKEIEAEFADVRAYLYMLGRALAIDEEAAVAEHVIPKCRERWPRPAEPGRSTSDRPRNPESSPVASADPELAAQIDLLRGARDELVLAIDSALSRLAGQSAPVANESEGAARGLPEHLRNHLLYVHPQPWRVGSKVARNVYDANSEGVAMFTHAYTAAIVVAAVNALAEPARSVTGPAPKNPNENHD